MSLSLSLLNNKTLPDAVLEKAPTFSSCQSPPSILASPEAVNKIIFLKIILIHCMNLQSSNIRLVAHGRHSFSSPRNWTVLKLVESHKTWKNFVVIFQVLLVHILLTDKSCEGQKADSDGTKIGHSFGQRFQFPVQDATRPKMSCFYTIRDKKDHGIWQRLRRCTIEHSKDPLFVFTSFLTPVLLSLPMAQ